MIKERTVTSNWIRAQITQNGKAIKQGGVNDIAPLPGIEGNTHNELPVQCGNCFTGNMRT